MFLRILKHWVYQVQDPDLIIASEILRELDWKSRRHKSTLDYVQMSDQLGWCADEWSTHRMICRRMVNLDDVRTSGEFGWCAKLVFSLINIEFLKHLLNWSQAFFVYIYLNNELQQYLVRCSGTHLFLQSSYTYNIFLEASSNFNIDGSLIIAIYNFYWILKL